MRNLLFVIVLLLVGIAGVGFYRGWFSLSTDNADQNPSATITVDQGKIKEDEQKTKEKMQDFGHNTAEAAGDLTDKAKQ